MSKEKKYRFYYSKKQNAVDEDMWGFTPRYTFVKTPDGYKQYSELCSIKGTRCNWEDAEIVYETDKMPDIVVHEAIPELISELQHRLSNCIEPKFKIGQEVWFIDWDRQIRIGKVDDISYFSSRDSIEYEIGYSNGYDEDESDWFGEKIIYTTEEEAKAKLEELKK